MTEDRRPQNLHRPLYAERVNAAIDFIELHLAEDLSLEQIAAVAHFSPFHFHRIFGMLVGETLSRFINRLRLERAATMLIQQPHRSVTDIASSCGLHNPSSFARSFRDMYDMSASEWRDSGFHSYQKENATSVRDLVGDMSTGSDEYGIVETRLGVAAHQSWTIRCGSLPNTVVEIVDMPDIEVAYVRHTGRYQGAAEVFAEIFGKLMKWAAPRGLVNEQAAVLAVYHDNPGITDDDKLRVSACIEVPTSVLAEGEIGRMRISGGSCAIARFELGAQDYGAAWFAVVGGWLPESGYEPDDRHPFERYPMTSTTSTGTEVVDICVPVRPLRRL